MSNKNRAERGYEDAIPVRRSKKAVSARSEMRKTASGKGSAEFGLFPAEDKTRPIPTKDTVTASAPAKRVPAPAPVVSPAVIAEDNTADSVADAVITADDSVFVQAEPVQPSEQPAKTRQIPVIREDTSHNENNGEAAVAVAVDDAPADDDHIVDEHIPGLSTVTRAARPVSADDENHRGGNQGLTAGKVVRRSLLSVLTALILAVATVFAACYTVATGPSESVRNTLVLSALQASATKWVPGLFLDDATVEEILADSQKVNTDVISVEDYQNSLKQEENDDKWAKAIDGMIYESVSGPTFKGYVLLVKDPSRLFVGVATDKFTDETAGLRIFEMAEKYDAVAAINGGEYPDAGGMGTGGRPIGLTYSGGECVWNDGLRRSFMGFDDNNRLICREGLTYKQAEELGIRDGVCFQTGKTLISNEDGNVTIHYADNNTGTAQRSAIGQAADGTVILLVTDGRTASSLGATHNDVIDIMVSYGAISAGMLDGGSSSLLYYKDFYDKYGLDKSDLDEYQEKGLINRYKAFTTPRRLPTCFIVAPEK